MNTRKKISLGAALASIAGMGITLSAILGWTSLTRPWGFLLGLLFGIATGAGAGFDGFGDCTGSDYDHLYAGGRRQVGDLE